MDGTGAYVSFIRYKNHVGWLVVALLLFGVGWQLGRVMSPYYAAQPIVFNDATCAPSASPGDPAALLDLRNQGIALREGTNDPSSPAPKVAGEVTVAAAAPQGTKLFVASVNSSLFHHKDCSSANQIKEENKVWFTSREEAEKAGYGPSKCTQEKLGTN